MRARNIKPGFFENEKLSELSPYARIIFCGLWCYADREGRFEWRPKRMKALILPYNDVDFNSELESLCAENFIIQYSTDGNDYGMIPNFLKHQKPHKNEKPSEIPPPCYD
jgi:hypothetical protein